MFRDERWGTFGHPSGPQCERLQWLDLSWETTGPPAFWWKRPWLNASLRAGRSWTPWESKESSPVSNKFQFGNHTKWHPGHRERERGMYMYIYIYVCVYIISHLNFHMTLPGLGSVNHPQSEFLWLRPLMRMLGSIIGNSHWARSDLKAWSSWKLGRSMGHPFWLAHFFWGGPYMGKKWFTSHSQSNIHSCCQVELEV